MSLEAVVEIIDRALSNTDFRGLLFVKPNEALRDYELTKDETAMLRNLASGPFTSARRGLIETKKLVIAAQEYQVGGEIE